MVSALVIYNKKSLAPLAVAMTLLLFYDFLITMGGVKDIIEVSVATQYQGGYSNKNILASAMFIKIPFAIWLFYFNKKTSLQIIRGDRDTCRYAGYLLYEYTYFLLGYDTHRGNICYLWHY